MFKQHSEIWNKLSMVLNPFRTCDPWGGSCDVHISKAFKHFSHFLKTEHYDFRNQHLILNQNCSIQRHLGNAGGHCYVTCENILIFNRLSLERVNNRVLYKQQTIIVKNINLLKDIESIIIHKFTTLFISIWRGFLTILDVKRKIPKLFQATWRESGVLNKMFVLKHDICEWTSK